MGSLAGHPYLTRAEWGARPPTSPLVAISLPTPRLWIHHSADDRQGVAAVRAHQAFHQDTRGWKDIAYTFLVGDDGTIFEGRGYRFVGGATAGDNATSHAICLLGNFDGHDVPAAQWVALVDLVRHGRDAGWWVPTCGGHRDAPGASTACPGRHLYARLPELRHAVTLPAGPVPAPEPEEPDMVIIDCPGKPALIVGVGGVQRINTPQRNALRTIGVEAKRVDPATSDALASLALDLTTTVDVDVDVKALAAELAQLVDATPGTLTGDEVEAIVDRALGNVLAAAAAAAES